MAGGLLALLDDVALIARSAAATSTKAAGVVIDDTAVTPQYLQGIKPKRELPAIWKITKGSLRNKLLIILPIALLLSWLAPWLLTPILMVGGTYLCFEGAEKIWDKLFGSDAKGEEKEQMSEDQMVSSAIRTDLILSAEIMIISLSMIMDEPLWLRISTLVVVAIFLTAGVYGVVALLIKMDDIGIAMLKRSNGDSKLGRALVKGMPIVLQVIGIVGTAAMLWVGGHIISSGLDEFGLHQPQGIIDSLASSMPNGALAWLAETGCSMVVGLIVGAVVVGIVKLVRGATK